MIPGDLPSADEHFMRRALDEAGKARSIGEVPVGAVVVRGGVIIASGHNRCIVDKDPTAHAEVVALRAAARASGNYRLDGCTLYVTLEPCPMCCGAMFHARVGRVVYGAADPRTGSAGSVVDLFAQRQLNHHAEVDGGVLGSDCGAMLQDFFRDRRRISKHRDPLREDALRTPESALPGIAPGMPVRSSFCTGNAALEGLRMHYLDTLPDPAAAGGTRAGPVWLLLHGPRAWSQRFQAAAAALAHAGHRAVAPDLIGFGRSDKPKREDFHDALWHARSLQALAESLELRGVVVVAEEGAWPIARTMMEQDPSRYAGSVLLAEEGGLPPPAWHSDAPYPDRGHRAGPRALERMRSPRPAPPDGRPGPDGARPHLDLAGPDVSPREESAWLRKAMEYFGA